MTQVAERPASTPLTNPVPGTWLQMPDQAIPPVYVPFEPQYKKNEATGKDIIVGFAPGAHIKRLLGEGAMYANFEQKPAPVASTEMDELRAQLAQSKSAHEQLMEELADLRAKMASDPGVPNTPKRSAR